MEELNDLHLAFIDNEQIALVHVEGNWQSEGMLSHLAGRIRRNVRRSDMVLIGEMLCLVVLTEASLEGAQVVARRLHALLADVEYTIQVLSGASARSALQTLHNAQPLYMIGSEIDAAPDGLLVSGQCAGDGLPYLAFLASYPSHRLLHLVPYDLARRYHCVPVGVERGVLTLATCQCLEQEAVSLFEEVTRKSIFQVRCEASLVEDVLCYWQNLATV
ncbi:MAG: hypothetical protein J2P37_04655 [Ktedonobacteraceae bacterium]|nr:hypothetical protein [Ktedonobacteraceae bacterium]MBO0789882.1 hypothetical protein [Ktedonobacteraceae bacterium]